MKIIDLKEKARTAIYKSFIEVADIFQEQPYYFLYESDIHCQLYHHLIQNYPYKIKLETNTQDKFTSNAIHSEINIGKKRKGKRNPDFLVYHTDHPVKVNFERERRFYFPSKSSLSRSVIQVKLNRSAKELRDHYTIEESGLKGDIEKTIGYDFDKAYFLFFDRSMKIDDAKYNDFVDTINRKTIEDNRIEIIYIGTNVKDPNNGILRCYSSGKANEI